MASKYFKVRQFTALAPEEKGRIYLMCGFAGPLALWWPVVKYLRRQGYSLSVFTFRTRPMSQLSIQTLPKVINDACTAVEQLEKQRKGPRPATVIGSSMGAVFAWHVAKRVKTVDKVVANSAYALISKMILESKVGAVWRRNLKKDNVDAETFRKSIVASEPITDFHLLTGKKILLFMNRDDQVVDFAHAQLFKDALEANGLEYTYIENEGMKHSKGIYHNLKSQALLDFLQS